MVAEINEVLVLAGYNANILSRANTTFGLSQTASAIFPLARIADDRPSQRFIFPAVAEDDFIVIDTNQLLNGSLDSYTAGSPNDWTVNLTNDATVEEETVSPINTGSSLQMDNGATGTVEVLQTISVLSGESLRLQAYTQTSNADSPTELEVYNPITNRYLTVAGLWEKRQQNAIEETSTSFGKRTLDFDMEPFTGTHEVSLTVRMHMTGAAVSRTHHYDDVFILPAVSLGSIHAHNLETAIRPLLSSSDSSLQTIPVDNLVGFDGASDLQRTGDFSGIADAKLFTLSLWFRLDGGDGTLMKLISSGSGRFEVERTATNTLRITGQNSGGTPILDISTAGTFLASSTVHHLLVSVDLLNTASDIRIDDVSDQVATTRTNDFIDFTTAAWSIGATTASANDFNGALSKPWFYANQFFDLSVTANRRRFINASLKEADLGADGSIPVGSPPHFFLGNNFGTFGTNLSGAGNFGTVTGTLTDEITLEAEMTIDIPTFYARLASDRYRRFWRYHFKGTSPTDTIEIGQLVLGDPVPLLRNPIQQDFSEVESLPLERLETRIAGDRWITQHSKQKQRAVRMSFSHRNAHQKLLGDLIWERTLHGSGPAIVVPNTIKTPVIHGSVEREEKTIRQASFDLVLTELIFRENPQGITVD